MEINYDNQNLILLPKDQISKLFLQNIYQHSHLGIAATMAKVRLRFWICGFARMMKAINCKCVFCQKLDKFFASQRMTPLPNERLKPSLPWQYTSVGYLVRTPSQGKLTKDAEGKLMA